MIALATVSDIKNKYSVTVDCQEHGISNINATICTVPGLEQEYKVGDTVVIGIEENTTSKIIVFGVIYNKNNKRNTSIASKSLEAKESFLSKNNISIGSIDSTKFSYLAELNTDLKDYFDDDFYKKVGDEIDSMVKESSQQTSSLENLMLDYNSTNETYATIDREIGETSSTSSKNIFGLLNMYDKTYNTNKGRLGDIGNENLKDLLDSISTEISSIGISSNAESNLNLSSGMLDRAEKMVNVTWTPKNTFHVWNSSLTYKKGTQYSGIPYSMFGDALYYEKWESHMEDNVDKTGEVSGYGLRTGPKYGSCCASFVSDILGLKPGVSTCSGLSGSSHLKKLTGNDRLVKNLKLGDVLIRTSDGGHARWVGTVTESTIDVYEQTNGSINGKPAGARKTSYKKSSVTASDGSFSGYTVYRPTDLEIYSVIKGAITPETFNSALAACKDVSLQDIINVAKSTRNMNTDLCKAICGTTAGEGYIDDPYLSFAWTCAVINYDMSSATSFYNRISGWASYYSKSSVLSHLEYLNYSGEGWATMRKAIYLAFTNTDPRIIEVDGMGGAGTVIYTSTVYTKAKHPDWPSDARVIIDPSIKLPETFEPSSTLDYSSVIGSTNWEIAINALKVKFPHGKYWNHAPKKGTGSKYNNWNGYTSTPCPEHGTCGTSLQTCNGYAPDGWETSWQCMGFANKCGYDVTGYDPETSTNWVKYSTESMSSNDVLKKLKPCSIIRYGGHSVFVTNVVGDTITFSDCNHDSQCIIRQGVTMSKQHVKDCILDYIRVYVGDPNLTNSKIVKEVKKLNAR